MLNKPIISLFCSAIKPHLWLNLYESLSSNKIPFEIVFVGPKKPKFKLPFNIIYIKSRVKPAQCAEIAYRNSNGSFVLNITDDLIFRKYFLDNLYRDFKKHNKTSKKIGIGSVWNGSNRSKKSPLNKRRFSRSNKDNNTPVMWEGIVLMKKEWWGGIDKRFIAGFYSWDNIMRFHENRGEIFPCKKAGWVETDIGIKNRLKIITKAYDFSLINALWTRLIKVGEKVPSEEIYDYARDHMQIVVCKKRLDKVQFFENEDILVKSQCNSPLWAKRKGWK